MAGGVETGERSWSLWLKIHCTSRKGSGGPSCRLGHKWDEGLETHLSDSVVSAGWGTRESMYKGHSGGVTILIYFWRASGAGSDWDSAGGIAIREPSSGLV